MSNSGNTNNNNNLGNPYEQIESYPFLQGELNINLLDTSLFTTSFINTVKVSKEVPTVESLIAEFAQVHPALWKVDTTVFHPGFNDCVTFTICADTGCMAHLMDFDLGMKYFGEKVYIMSQPAVCQVADAGLPLKKCDKAVNLLHRNLGGGLFAVKWILYKDLTSPTLASAEFCKQLGFDIGTPVPKKWMEIRNIPVPDGELKDLMKLYYNHIEPLGDNFEVKEANEKELQNTSELIEEEGIKSVNSINTNSSKLNLPSTPFTELVDKSLSKYSFNVVKVGTVGIIKNVSKIGGRFTNLIKNSYKYKPLVPKLIDSVMINDQFIPSMNIRDITIVNNQLPINHLKVQNLATFEASETEMKEAMKLVGEFHYEIPEFNEIKQEFGEEAHKDFMSLVNQYDRKQLFPKHRYDVGCVKDYPFDMGIDEKYDNKIIWRPQYDLKPVERTVYLYDTMQRKEYGLIEECSDSRNQISSVIVSKNGPKGERLRVARDFSPWNPYITPVETKIPTFREIDYSLRGEGRYIVFDIFACFDHILLIDDKRRCVIDTPIGKFRLLRAEYGHKRIMAHVQYITNLILIDKRLPKRIIYVDDGAIKCWNIVSYEDIKLFITIIFDACLELGFKLSLHKLAVYIKAVKAVGNIYDHLGKSHTKQTKQKILNVPKPKNKKENRSFLSFARFLNESIYDQANLLYQLQLLEKNDIPWKWTIEEEEAFKAIKEAIEHSGILCHASDSGKMTLWTDTSDYAYASAVFQEQFCSRLNKLRYKLVGFWSALFPREIENKPIGVKELYGVTHGSAHWKDLLWTREFNAVTDHKNLCYQIKNLTPAMRNSSVIRNMIILLSSLPIVLKQSNGEFINFVDYGSRIGFDGTIAKKIRDNLKLKQKLKRLEKMKTREYLRYYGDFDELEIQANLDLQIIDPQFHSNVEAINFKQTLIFLVGIKHGVYDLFNQDIKFIDNEIHLLGMNSMLNNKSYIQHIRKFSNIIFAKGKDYKRNKWSINVNHELIESKPINSLLKTNKNSLSTLSKNRPKSILSRKRFMNVNKINSINDGPSDTLLNNRLEQAGLNQQINKFYYSTFERDRGENPRGIIDVKLALENLKQVLTNGIPNLRGAQEILNDLHYKIKLFRDDHDEKNLQYIYRYKYQMDFGDISNGFNDNKRLESFDIGDKVMFFIGDKVMFFIGDRSKTCQKWQARFSGPFDIITKYNENVVEIENKELNIRFDVSTSMLKLYKDDGDWKKEMNYEKLQKAKEKLGTRRDKQVRFE